VSLSFTLGLSAVSDRESRVTSLSVNLLDHPHERWASELLARDTRCFTLNHIPRGKHERSLRPGTSTQLPTLLVDGANNIPA
jgi:hypothetical protein